MQEGTTMTVLFRVRIDGETHRIRIDVPDGGASESPDLAEFAVRTARLEHSGYIPRGAVGAIDDV
jgi:hypothetical protein